MAKKKKKQPALAVAGTVGAHAPINAEHRALVELAHGEDLTLAEWASVRQCLRCLVQGKRLVKSVGGRRQVAVSNEPAVPTAGEAVILVLKEAKRRKCDVVEAARKLTFVDE